MAEQQKVTVGRVVHVIPPGKKDVHAATVTKVWSQDNGGYVNVVYLDCQEAPHAKPMTSCTYVPELKAEHAGGHYWTWPPRA